MNRIIAAGIGMFAAASLSVAAQSTPPGQAQRDRAPGGDREVTVTGCVTREIDYRKAHDKGRAGVAGSGIGAENEFVLTSATIARGTGTGNAYELTGAGEGQLGKYINQRVEIVGRLKGGDTTATGKPTGGESAGTPPRGVDVLSKDLRLRELEVISAKASTSGTCTAH